MPKTKRLLHVGHSMFAASMVVGALNWINKAVDMVV
jgi:hypothetical protein